MKQAKRKIEVDFMYIDLSSCTRCKGTDTSLDKAISEVAHVLEIVGVEVIVRKTHVQSEEQARQLGFVSSPTILINGRDIQEKLKESLCESCTDLTGGQQCDCRVWTYEDKEYTAPPPALIVDAILREVYSIKSECCPPKQIDVPDNLKKFFAVKKS